MSKYTIQEMKNYIKHIYANVQFYGFLKEICVNIQYV